MKLHDWYECKKCDKFHPLESDTVVKITMNKDFSKSSNSLEFFQYVNTYSSANGQAEIRAADDQFSAIFDQRLLMEQAAGSRAEYLQVQRLLSQLMHCVGRAIGLKDKGGMKNFNAFCKNKKILKFLTLVIPKRCVW